MKALICEMCGSHEIVRQNGLYVCQSCGTKYEPASGNTTGGQKKYCIHCGQLIDRDCVICTSCGKQVEELKVSHVFTGSYWNENQSGHYPGGHYASDVETQRGQYRAEPQGEPKDKWTALLLCIFLGYFGAHKFYEGNSGMGILYLFTFGLFGYGWLIDIVRLFAKPNPYYVNNK